MSDDSMEPNGYTGSGLNRRSVLKTLGAGGIAAAIGGSGLTNVGARPASGQAEAVAAGDGDVAYQYFHSEWTEIEDDVDRLAQVGIDRIWVQQPASAKLDWENLSYDGETGYYDETSPYGFRDPHPPLGYQPVDLTDLDSALGTEAELESLIETCHDHGIEVIVDVVLNHMAAEQGPDGFVDLPGFDREDHFHDNGTLGEDCELDGEAAEYECDLLSLPSLNVELDHVLDAHQAYIRRIADLGADGLRYDAAGHVWPWYWEGQINPLADDLGLWRVGEIWDGDRNRLEEFVDTGMTVFDFSLYYAIQDAFENRDMTQLSAAAGRGLVHSRPEGAVTFVQNHDTVGPNVEEGEAEGRMVELAEAFIIAYPGMPMLYRSNPEQRPELDDDELATLIEVSETAAGTPVIDRHSDSDTYVFEREGALLAAINASTSEQSYRVETSWSDETLVDATGSGADVAVDGTGQVEITVPAEGYVLYTPGDGDPDPDPDPELLGTWTDPAGDDHGPGSYTYPTNDVFVDGAFDLRSLELYGNENVYRFVVELENLTDPWNLGYGYSLQYLQLYAHDPAADDSAASGFADEGVNVAFDRDCHRRIHANGEDGAWVEDGTGEVLMDAQTSASLADDRIEIEVPADAFESDPTDIEFVPLLLGYDGTLDPQIRPVNSTTSEWQFGGGEDDDSNPNVIDLLTPEGVDNAEALAYTDEAGAVVPLLSVDDDDGDDERSLDLTDLEAPEGASQGEEITVSATAGNPGGVVATEPVEFRIGGEVVGTAEVSVDPGNQEDIEFGSIDTTALDPGTYDHGIFGEETSVTAEIEIRPGLVTYANEDSIVDDRGLRGAIDDWRADEIGTALLVEVLDAWRSGDPVN